MTKTMNVLADESGTIKLDGILEDHDGKMFIAVKILLPEKNGRQNHRLYHLEKDKLVVEDGKSVKEGDLLGTYAGPGFIFIGARRIEPANYPVGIKEGEKVRVQWDCDLFGSDGRYYTLRLSGIYGLNSNPDFYNLAGVSSNFRLLKNEEQDKNPIPFDDRKDLEELKGLGLEANNTGKVVSEHLRPGPDELLKTHGLVRSEQDYDV